MWRLLCRFGWLAGLWQSAAVQLLLCRMCCGALCTAGQRGTRGGAVWNMFCCLLLLLQDDTPEEATAALLTWLGQLQPPALHA